MEILNTKYRVVIIILLLVFGVAGLITIKVEREKRFQHAHEYYYSTMHQFYKRINDQGLDKSFIFLGASIVQGLNTASIVDRGLNFGIGGDTLNGLSKRLKEYSNLHQADAVFIQVGGNDLNKYTINEIYKSIQRISEELNFNKTIIWSGLFPAPSTNAAEQTGRTNARIDQVNHFIKKQCSQIINCYYLSPPPEFYDEYGGLDNAIQTGDGIHLNIKGYHVWQHYIKTTLNRISQIPPAISE